MGRRLSDNRSLGMSISTTRRNLGVTMSRSLLGECAVVTSWGLPLADLETMKYSKRKGHEQVGHWLV